MESRPNACLICHKPFPPNGELASIPESSKVAFDPERRRVWRIYESCGEWNLLGAEASAAALPELEARFAAAPKAGGDAGFAPAHVGKSLQLLQIGGTAVIDLNDAAALRRRKMMVLGATIGMVGLTIGGVIGLGDVVFISLHHIWTDTLVGYLTAGSMTFLATRVIRIRHGLPVKRRSIVAGVVLALAGIALDVLTGGPYWLVGLIPVAVITSVVALIVPPIPIISMRLSHNYDVRFYSQKEVTDVTMSWTPDGEIISLHGLPDGGTVSGDDAEFLLRRLVRTAVGVRILLRTRARRPSRRMTFCDPWAGSAAYSMHSTAFGVTATITL